MLLLFDLGRPDVWPVDDYGVRKGFAKTFGRRQLPTPKQLVKFGEKWRPYRSVAAWYFWRALDQRKSYKLKKVAELKRFLFDLLFHSSTLPTHLSCALLCV